MAGLITTKELHPSLLDYIGTNGSGGGTGTGSVKCKKNSVTINTGAAQIVIGIPQYNKTTDILMVFKNSTYMEENEDYTISPDSTKIIAPDGETWNSNNLQMVFNFIVFKNVPEIENIDASLINIKDIDNHFNATNVEDALKEVFTNVDNGKASIAQAIIAKGITNASKDDDFNELSTKISNIRTGSGNAQPSDVLAGKTFTNNNGEQTGTIPDRGNVVIKPGVSNQTKPSGYYSGEIMVSGDANLVPANIVSGKSIFGVAGTVKQANGNVQASEVLAGKTFSNDGGSGTGTMPNRGGAVTVTPGVSNQVKSSGYYSGDITILGDPDLVAGNIKEGVNIFGVTGTVKQLPTGWDSVKNGVAFGGNINQNDAVVWKRYGDWQSSIKPIPNFNLPGLSLSERYDKVEFSPDGKYLVVVKSLSSTFYIYKIDNDTFTKLPNPSVLPGTIKKVEFSSNSLFLMIKSDTMNNSVLYSIKNDVFTSLAKPTTTTSTLDDMVINKDATVMATKTKDSENSYFQIFTKDSNVWVEKFKQQNSSDYTNLVMHPSGNAVYRADTTSSGVISIYIKQGGVYVYDNIVRDKGGFLQISCDGEYGMTRDNSNNAYIFSCNIASGEPLKFENKITSLIRDFRGFKISPDSSTCALYSDTSSSDPIRICSLSKYNLTNIKTVPVTGYISDFDICVDYLIITPQSGLPSIVRTTTKDIVEPITSGINSGALLINEVGIALNSGTVGQNIKVNTFPKLKL